MQALGSPAIRATLDLAKRLSISGKGGKKKNILTNEINIFGIYTMFLPARSPEERRRNYLLANVYLISFCETLVSITQGLPEP